MTSKQEAYAKNRPLYKMVTSLILQVVLCLLAIGCVRQATGWGLAEAAQLGMTRGTMNELGGHLEGRNLIEKRFIFQGPSGVSPDDKAGVGATSNKDRKRASRTARNNDNSEEEEDDDNSNNNNNNNSRGNDDNDDDSDDDNNDSDGLQTRFIGQQAAATGGGPERLVAVASTTSAGSGAKSNTAAATPAPVEPVSAGKKTDDSQRPRLFKMGLLIG